MNQMRRSLSVKLIVGFVTVTILGTVMLALLVNWQTRRQFDALVNELYQDDLIAHQAELTDYYLANGSWDGVERILVDERERPSRPSPNSVPDTPPPSDSPPPDDGDFGAPFFKGVPITLVDSQQQLIYGDRRYRSGERLPNSVLEGSLPIEANGEIVGWIVLDFFSNANFSDSPEAKFLGNLNRTTVWSAILAGGLALLLGVWLARTISHPVQALTAATQKVAQGKLGEQVAVQSGDEIGQLAASFNQMSADLARSNALRRQMTADIAHDLRTPLSVVQGYTEALDDGKLPGSSEIYQVMHKQVKHLNRLVEDLRTLSLADAGQLSLHPTDVSPRDLLEHTLLMYAPQAEQQQVDLQLDIAERMSTINVDLDRMVQVLGNLISNALRHTPPNGRILLSAHPQNQQAVLKISDTGIGIAPEELPHVFDRFYRGDKARSDNGASGLGLAIARSIVVAHNGRISATSTPGQGTTFSISLPFSHSQF